MFVAASELLDYTESTVNRLNLFRHAEATKLDSGHVIFTAGESGNCMYAIAEGKIDIKAGEILLETLGEGDFFGEMALVDHAPRSATAVSATPVSLVTVDEKTFIRLVQANPYFALEVMQIMATRLRNANARLASAK